MLSSPRRPARTILIFSSAEYCLRVFRLMPLNSLSAASFDAPDFLFSFLSNSFLPSVEVPACTSCGIYFCLDFLSPNIRLSLGYFFTVCPGGSPDLLLPQPYLNILWNLHFEHPVSAIFPSGDILSDHSQSHTLSHNKFPQSTEFDRKREVHPQFILTGG